MAAVSDPELVVIHPIVLLGTVDHYKRVAQDTSKRVVGVMLGESYKGRVDVVNSFAVPFEEDRKDPTIFYLDRDYMENMAAMFRKINSRERIVGFYSTGPTIRPADLAIHEMFRKYCRDPVLAVIDIRPEGDEGLPIKSYRTVEVVKDGKETQRTFEHIACEVGAFEVEQVGVEHLLRDVNDPSVSSLAEDVRAKVIALRGLRSRLASMSQYLDDVCSGKLPPNDQVMYTFQKIFNLLPSLNLESVTKAIIAKTNDMHLGMYVASLVRTIAALHDLVNNKIQSQELEDAEERRQVGKADDKGGKDKGKGEKEGKADGEVKSSKDKPADSS